MVNCSSASASFLTDLSGPGRVIVTATRSGSESNYARFGKYLSESLSNLQADIDHDQEVSLLEAFLMATSQTERFYEQDARLTTEHALLDDNGDRNGVTGDFYQGIRPVKVPKQGQAVDGLEASLAILYSSPNAPQFTSELAGQRAQLERQLDSLRSQKTQLSEAEYFGQLEALLLELAHLYDLAEG